MALINIQALANTLEDTRKTLLEATNGDGIVSRNDFNRLLEETQDPLKKRFLELFYRFIIKLEDRSGVRVTEAVIDKGIAFVQEQIMPHFEIKELFSETTNQAIAQTHESAFPLAMELIRYTADNAQLNPKQVSEKIEPLTEGLYFDDYGSEAAIGIQAFFVEHPATTLTPESFAQAMGLDPNTPKGKIERFDPADRVLLTFVEQHIGTGRANQAKTIVDLMKDNLTQLTIIVVGQDNHPDLESNHPVYVVGIGEEGDLAGFDSFVVWT